MPLSSGARLGPHEILAAIGAAGMGEVYKARDTPPGWIAFCDNGGLCRGERLE